MPNSKYISASSLTAIETNSFDLEKDRGKV